jgi:hypothetical protein
MKKWNKASTRREERLDGCWQTVVTTTRKIATDSESKEYFVSRTWLPPKKGSRPEGRGRCPQVPSLEELLERGYDIAAPKLIWSD